jgi:hypothetical protein
VQEASCGVVVVARPHRRVGSVRDPSDRPSIRPMRCGAGRGVR